MNVFILFFYFLFLSSSFGVWSNKNILWFCNHYTSIAPSACVGATEYILKNVRMTHTIIIFLQVITICNPNYNIYTIYTPFNLGKSISHDGTVVTIQYTFHLHHYLVAYTIEFLTTKLYQKRSEINFTKIRVEPGCEKNIF